MRSLHIPQPDITLHLDMGGVIQDATLSGILPQEDLDRWVGRPWSETVADVGSEKVKRLVEDARWVRVSGFRQINQRFPSGREILIEYAAIRLGDRSGMIAVGRNLQAVAELQAKLIEAQQSIEREYWKLREVETRYRHLFENSDEAVILVRAANLRILEANPAALGALGADRSGADTGRVVLNDVMAEDRDAFRAMLERARQQGKSTGIRVRFGPHGDPWLARASLMTSETGHLFLLQLSWAGVVRVPADRATPVSVEGLVARSSDPFVVIDLHGGVQWHNRAFLELVRLDAGRSVIGEFIGRWLGSPGSDVGSLLASVCDHGPVRRFPTTIRDEFGTEARVDISAVGNIDTEPQYFGVLLRHRSD